MTETPQSHSGILIISRRKYYSTFLRLPLAIVFFLFGVEIMNSSDFTSLSQLSLFKVFKVSEWILFLIPNLDQATQIIYFGAFTISALLFLGILTRTTSVLISALSIIGILTSPQLLSDPVITLFQIHLNILLLGTAISLLFNGPGALSLKRKATGATINPIEKVPLPNKIAAIILRISLAITLMIIFISVFFWVNENNIIWSYYIDHFLNSIQFISIPVITSILGTSSVLLLHNVGTRPISYLVTGVFAVLILLNGISSYPLIIIIGACAALMSYEEEVSTTKTVKHHQEKFQEMTEAVSKKIKEEKTKKTQRKKPKQKKLTPKK